MSLRSRNKRSIVNRTKKYRKKLTAKRYRKLKGGGLAKASKGAKEPKTGPKPSGKRIAKAKSYEETSTTTKPTGKAVIRAKSSDLSSSNQSSKTLEEIKKELRENQRKIGARLNLRKKDMSPSPGLTKFRKAARKVINQRSVVKSFEDSLMTVNDSGVKSRQKVKERVEFQPGKNQLAGLNLANTNNTRTGMLSNKKIDEMRKKQKKFDNAFTKELERALAKPKEPTTRSAKSLLKKNNSKKNGNGRSKPSNVEQIRQEQQEIDDKKFKLVKISQKVAINTLRASKELDDKSEQIAKRFAQYLARNYGRLDAADIDVNKIVNDLNGEINKFIKARPTPNKGVRENTLDNIMNFFETK